MSISRLVKIDVATGSARRNLDQLRSKLDDLDKVFSKLMSGSKRPESKGFRTLNDQLEKYSGHLNNASRAALSAANNMTKKERATLQYDTAIRKLNKASAQGKLNQDELNKALDRAQKRYQEAASAIDNMAKKDKGISALNKQIESFNGHLSNSERAALQATNILTKQERATLQYDTSLRKLNKAFAEGKITQDQLSLAVERSSGRYHAVSVSITKAAEAASKIKPVVKTIEDFNGHLDNSARNSLQASNNLSKQERATLQYDTSLRKLNKAFAEGKISQEDLNNSLNRAKNKYQEVSNAITKAAESSNKVKPPVKTIEDFSGALSKAARASLLMSNNLTKQERETLRYDTTLRKLNRALSQGKIDQATFNTAIERASRRFKEVTTEVDKTDRGLKRHNNSVNGLSGSYRTLAGAITAVGSALAGSQLINTLDTYTDFQSRLKLTQQSGEELAETERRLIEIALETRSSIQANSLLYLRLSDNVDRAKVSQEELLEIQGTVNKAVSIGGSSAQEAAGAIRQFTQILGSGFITSFSQEINSLADQTPGLLKAIVEGMRETNQQFRDLEASGTIGTKALKVFSERSLGELDDLLTALKSQTESVAEAHENMNITVSKGLLNIGTALTVYMGQVDHAAGFTKAIATAFDDMAKSMGGAAAEMDFTEGVNSISLVLGALGGAALAVGAYAAALGVAKAAQIAFNIAVAANPYILMAAGVAALAGALYAVRNNTIQLGESVATVSNYIAAFFEEISSGSSLAVGVVSSYFDQFASDAAFVAGYISRTFGGMFDSILNVAKNHINNIIGIISTIGDVSVIIGRNMAKAFTSAFDSVLNIGRGFWESLQAIFDGDFSFASFRSALREQLINPMIDASIEIAGAYDKNINTDYFGNIANDIINTATSFADRVIASAESKYQLSNSSLNDSISESNKLSSDATSSTNDHNEALESLKQGYIDQLTTLNMTNAELARYNMLKAGASVEEAEFYSNLVRQADAAKDSASALSASANEFDNWLNGVKDSLDPMRELQREAEKTWKALAAGELSETEAREYISTLTNGFKESGDELDSLINGVQDSIDPMLEAYLSMYQGIESATVSLLESGFKDTQSFFDSIVSSFKKMLAEMAYQAAIKPIVVQTVAGILPGGSQGKTGTDFLSTALGQSAPTGSADPVAEATDAALPAGAGGASMAAGAIAAGALVTVAAINAHNKADAERMKQYTAEYRQAEQSTGTVLGDISAKSHSVSELTAELVDMNTDVLSVNHDMLTSLRAIESGITGVSNGIAQQLTRAGGLEDYAGSIQTSELVDNSIGLGAESIVLNAAGLDFIGDFVDGLIGSVSKAIYSKKKSLQDAGIDFAEQTLGHVIDDGFVSADAFQRIKTTRRTLGIKSSSSSKNTFDMDDAIQYQLGEIFGNAASVLADVAGEMDIAARLVDQSVEGYINSLSIDASELSLKGLKGDELSAEIEAYISSNMDSWASQMLDAADMSGWVEQYQQAGEGVFQTLGRLTAQSRAFQETADLLGLQFDASGLQSAELVQSLATLAGGFDQLQSQTSAYYANYFSEAEQQAHLQQQLTTAFNELNQTLPASKSEFRALVESLDLTSESGQHTYARMMQLQGVFNDYAVAVDKVTAAEQRRLAAISDFNSGIEQQLQQLSLSGKDLELFNLDQEFERLRTEAEDVGGDLELVERLYGQKRADIVAEYAQQTLTVSRQTTAAVQQSTAAQEARNKALEEEQKRLEALAGIESGFERIGQTFADVMDEATINFIDNVTSKFEAAGGVAGILDSELGKQINELPDMREGIENVKEWSSYAGEYASGIANSLNMVGKADLPSDIPHPILDTLSQSFSAAFDAQNVLGALRHRTYKDIDHFKNSIRGLQGASSEVIDVIIEGVGGFSALQDHFKDFLATDAGSKSSAHRFSEWLRENVFDFQDAMFGDLSDFREIAAMSGSVTADDVKSLFSGKIKSVLDAFDVDTLNGLIGKESATVASIREFEASIGMVNMILDESGQLIPDIAATIADAMSDLDGIRERFRDDFQNAFADAMNLEDIDQIGGVFDRVADKYAKAAYSQEELLNIELAGHQQRLEQFADLGLTADMSIGQFRELFEAAQGTVDGETLGRWWAAADVMADIHIATEDANGSLSDLIEILQNVTSSIRETANAALDPDLFDQNKLNEALSAFGFEADADLGEVLSKLSQINSEELSFFDRVYEGMSESLSNTLERVIPDSDAGATITGILDKAWTNAGLIDADFSVEGLYNAAGGMEELGLTVDEFASNLDGYAGVIANANEATEKLEDALKSVSNSIRETSNAALDPDLFDQNKLNEALSAFGFEADADLESVLQSLSSFDSDDIEGLYNAAGGMEELGITLDEFSSNLDGYTGIIVNAYKEQGQSAEDFANALKAAQSDFEGFSRGISDYLASLQGTPKGMGTPQDIFASARNDFRSELEAAESGDRDALDKITSYSDRYLEAAKDMYGSGEPAQNVLNEITSALSALPDKLSAEEFLAKEFRSIMNDEFPTTMNDLISATAYELDALIDFAIDDTGIPDDLRTLLSDFVGVTRKSLTYVLSADWLDQAFRDLAYGEIGTATATVKAALQSDTPQGIKELILNASKGYTANIMAIAEGNYGDDEARELLQSSGNLYRTTVLTAALDVASLSEYEQNLLSNDPSELVRHLQASLALNSLTPAEKALLLDDSPDDFQRALKATGTLTPEQRTLLTGFNPDEFKRALKATGTLTPEQRTLLTGLNPDDFQRTLKATGTLTPEQRTLLTELNPEEFERALHADTSGLTLWQKNLLSAIGGTVGARMDVNAMFDSDTNEALSKIGDDTTVSFDKSDPIYSVFNAIRDNTEEMKAQFKEQIRRDQIKDYRDFLVSEAKSEGNDFKADMAWVGGHFALLGNASQLDTFNRMFKDRVGSMFGAFSGYADDKEYFAKGGVFTNTVVDKPTPFNIGVMGEAGPEAIMPLHRGPGGSLGVRAEVTTAKIESQVHLATVLNEVKQELKESSARMEKRLEKLESHAEASVKVQQHGFKGQISAQYETNKELKKQTSASRLESTK